MLQPGYQLRYPLPIEVGRVAIDKSEGVVKRYLSQAVREPAFSTSVFENQGHWRTRD